MFAIGLILFSVSVDIKLSYCAPTSDSRLSETVLLTLSNITLEQWHKESKDTVLKSALANLTTEYCNSNPSKCGLTSHNPRVTFNAQNVKFIENYPVNNVNKDLEILFYIEIPANNSETSTKISSSALVTMLTDNKARLSSDVGTNVRSAVSGTSSDSDDGKTSGARLNKIMIPISFILLLIVALTAFFLHRSQKKRKARQERLLLRQYSKKAGKKIAEERQAGSSNQFDASPQVRLTEFRLVREDDNRPAQPKPLSPELDTHVQEEKRHRRRKKSTRKKPITRTATDESDDVFNARDGNSEPEIQEKTKKKGRRRRSRRLDDRESIGTNAEHGDVIQKDESIGECEHDVQQENGAVNVGYRRDCENGASGRSSIADSAVELSSSVASSQQYRAKNLPPISQPERRDAI